MIKMIALYYGELFLGFSTADAGRIFHKLMLRLGYSKYYLQGGDWGSIITTTMAQLYPQ